MKTLEQLRETAIEIPLTTSMKQRANMIADEQRQQNALGVLAVAEYLEHWQGYALDLEQSDVWNPVLRKLDVADVPIVGLGRLECRLVKDQENLTTLPPEVWHDRIGYVFVELQPDSAKLLGFGLPFDPQQDEPMEPESIDSLLEHLARLEVAMPIVAEELNMDADRRAAIVAQLERIYRQERSSRWGLRAEEVLTGRSGVGMVREEGQESSESIKDQELAERLMERLTTAWNQLRGQHNG